jgi:hypothetical protein
VSWPWLVCDDDDDDDEDSITSLRRIIRYTCWFCVLYSLVCLPSVDDARSEFGLLLLRLHVVQLCSDATASACLRQALLFASRPQGGRSPCR